MKRFFMNTSELREEYPTGYIVQLKIVTPTNEMFEFQGTAPEETMKTVLDLFKKPNPPDYAGEEPTRGIRGIGRETRE